MPFSRSWKDSQPSWNQCTARRSHRAQRQHRYKNIIAWSSPNDDAFPGRLTWRVRRRSRRSCGAGSRVKPPRNAVQDSNGFPPSKKAGRCLMQPGLTSSGRGTRSSIFAADKGENLSTRSFQYATADRPCLRFAAAVTSCAAIIDRRTLVHCGTASGIARGFGDAANAAGSSHRSSRVATPSCPSIEATRFSALRVRISS
jgi:hypothetical protein